MDTVDRKHNNTKMMASVSRIDTKHMKTLYSIFNNTKNHGSLNYQYSPFLFWKEKKSVSLIHLSEWMSVMFQNKFQLTAVSYWSN